MADTAGTVAVTAVMVEVIVKLAEMKEEKTKRKVAS